MRITSITIAGKPIDFAGERHRPPGPIADQDTEGAGVWIRLAPDGPWWKTDLTHDRAVRVAMRAETAEAALAAMLAGSPAPAAAAKAEAPASAAPKAEPGPVPAAKAEVHRPAQAKR